MQASDRQFQPRAAPASGRSQSPEYSGGTGSAHLGLGLGWAQVMGREGFVDALVPARNLGGSLALGRESHGAAPAEGLRQ